MSQQFDKLKTLLKELFQLDQPDLDFGFYRIMHAKSAEVSKFLDEDLLPQVKAAFGAYQSADKAVIQRELAQAIAQAQSLGADPETLPKVKALRERLANEAVDLAGLEAEVYDHLHSFFRRYYSEGDFLSKRVYKPGVYAIPYEGEEVKLHWANADQYYIKTSEYLRDYAFRLKPDDAQDPMRVHFRLVDAAEGEHGNVKAAEGKGRMFVLAAEDPIGEVDGEAGRELVIRFEYRPATLDDWPESERPGKSKPPAQKDLLSMADSRVLAAADAALHRSAEALGRPHIKSDGDPAEYSRLRAHLNRYAARNTFDYFIHKDLGGFLRRELDFYIKNEVMHLDDIESESAPRVEQYLSKIKVIRKIAGKVIDFLAQLENFQKTLWLKKKFVVETSHLITLDKIPESFYPEIAANEAQLGEWIRLFGVDKTDDVTSQPFSVPLAVDFLYSNSSLPISTSLFSAHFTERVLDSQADLDSSLTGVVISSEATQTSRFVTRRLAGRIGVVLADPPYNTGSDGFQYKDTYQHASWLTMVADATETLRRAMRPDALCAVFIDDHEMYRLGLLMNRIFGEQCRAACAPWKSEASGGKEKTGLRTGHEYILIYHNGDPASIAQAEISTGLLDREDKLGKYRKGRELRKWGGASSRSDRPGQWFALRTPDGSDVYPIKNDGSDGHWRWGKDNPAIKTALLDTNLFHWEKCNFDSGIVRDGAGERWVPFEKIRDEKKSVGWSTWLDTLGANADATRELKAMFGGKPFETPKPVSVYRWLITLHGDEDIYVADLFAGSGTTAHAVMDTILDGSNRRFLVADIGVSVQDVILPRVLKASYSRSWKEGKPVKGGTGCPLFCKHLVLESYEDALNNLDIRRTTQQQSLLDAPEAQGAEGLREQYLLRYMLDVETRGSQSLLDVGAFMDPRAYTLKVKRRGSDESRDVNVDLLETFNWLIGITVRHLAAPQTFSTSFVRDDDPDLAADAVKRLLIDGRIKENAAGPWWFRTVTGTLPDGRKAIVIWRTRPGGETPEGVEQDNAVLDAWFQKQGYSSKDSEFDLIYVNGGNNLENLKAPDDTWKVRLIEEDFHRLMFDTEDV